MSQMSLVEMHKSMIRIFCLNALSFFFVAIPRVKRRKETNQSLMINHFQKQNAIE
jgi:hypothetical protein